MRELVHVQGGRSPRWELAFKYPACHPVPFRLGSFWPMPVVFQETYSFCDLVSHINHEWTNDATSTLTNQTNTISIYLYLLYILYHYTILLTEGILHHLECVKLVNNWDIYHINQLVQDVFQLSLLLPEPPSSHRARPVRKSDRC